MISITILLCLSASLVWSETMDDLVMRDNLYYKKFTDVPFTGKVTGNGSSEWRKSFISKGSFKNGKKNGLWIRYYDNGQLWDKGTYINGKKEGYWIAYFDDGKLWYKGNMRNGNEDGFWIFYFSNGQLHYKGKYINFKKEGPWVSYLRDGSVIPSDTGTFKDGKKISD